MKRLPARDFPHASCSSLSGNFRQRSPLGFTLIEMLAAMAVLSLLVVAMMAIVESATKLWRDSEGRTDACREARAALLIMARDLSNAVAGTNVDFMKFNLRSGAAGTDYGSNVFFLASLPASAQSASSKSDVCEIGYFLALDRTAASTNRTLNLYRYFRNSNQTFSNLSTSSLFTNITTGATGEELVARNVVGMKITPVSASEGDWIPFGPTAEAPLPKVIEITLSAIGQDAAKKLQDSTNWTDTNFPVIRQALQTLSTRVSVGNSR
ncbi:MAG TPA: prepilin-type N-terminal cleavage/methylation domain-containing protein [Terrimicrobiaceae bacterium]